MDDFGIGLVFGVVMTVLVGGALWFSLGKSDIGFESKTYSCVEAGGSVKACEIAIGETDMSQCLAAGGNLGACWEAVD